jgi:hypothetical protein
MIVGREACHHFLVNFLGVEDDNEPPGLSLFLGFFSSNGSGGNRYCWGDSSFSFSFLD